SAPAPRSPRPPTRRPASGEPAAEPTTNPRQSLPAWHESLPRQSYQTESCAPHPDPDSRHRPPSRNDRAVLLAADMYLPAQAGSALPARGTAWADRGARPRPLRVALAWLAGAPTGYAARLG